MTDEQDVLYEVRDNIAYVTMNRPERYNSTRHQDYELLYQHFKKAHDDNEVRAVILSGVGEDFSVSDDISGLKTKDSPWSNRVYGHFANQSWADYIVKGEERSPAQEMMRLIIESGTVFICCMQGRNYMPELTFWFDYAVAADTAMISSCDLLVGQSPAGGLSIMLPRIAGRRVALETFLDQTPMSGEEAYRRGLVNKVVPVKDMMTAAEEFAKKIMPYNPMVIALYKKLITRSQGPVEEFLTMEQMFCGFAHALPGAGRPAGDSLNLINYPTDLMPSADLSAKYLEQESDVEKKAPTAPDNSNVTLPD